MPPGGQQGPKKRIKGINSATTWPWFCRKIMLCNLEFREKLSGKSITQLVQISSLQRVLFPGTQKYYGMPLSLSQDPVPAPTCNPSSFFLLLPSWHLMFQLFHIISWFETPRFKFPALYGLSPLTGRPERNHIWYNLCSQWLEKWLAHSKMLSACLLNWMYHSPCRQMAISQVSIHCDISVFQPMN